ncbi:DMT family transporter [Fuscovulum ytuae]|uniref:DMT family transporter n=1 Tax=Fuscovulum ytuae TaxID=3042299 RepID=A0ABY8QBS8_9RHOB|nr:DMT family transporter [Fuscovulum sp. YMD61]WGV18154.1 DMT family transporter [Fuscovulum sp. YMD61]
MPVAVPVTGRRWFHLAVLLCLGLGWGMTQPLGKMATAEGHGPFGLIFWQLVVCVLVLGALCLPRRKGLVFSRPALRFYVVVAALGTLIPNATFYLSIARLPSGVMSMIISAVPMIAFPLAVILGMERFGWLRLLGLCLGLVSVLLLAAPGAVLPDAAMAAFLPLAMVGPLCYALEGLYVARYGTAGMDPVQAMFGASVAGLIGVFPVAMLTGQFFDPFADFGQAEAALAGSSALHAVIYAAYVWLAFRAGAVFASQCSYIVTGAGIFWAMLLLGERFPPSLWLSLVLLLSGVALVSPRAREGRRG